MNIDYLDDARNEQLEFGNLYQFYNLETIQRLDVIILVFVSSLKQVPIVMYVESQREEAMCFYALEYGGTAEDKHRKCPEIKGRELSRPFIAVSVD